MADPTWIDLLSAATSQLRLAGSETPRLDSELILAHLLGWDRTTLLGYGNERGEPPIIAAFGQAIERRAAGEPMAYITGHKAFCTIDLEIGPGVLVPRPETELLAEWAVSWLKQHPGASMVDVATGSGAIALAVTAMLPAGDWGIIGSDRSPSAQQWAERNRIRLGLEVEFVLGDLLQWRNETVDLIVANLPYLTPAQLESNPDLSHEPTLALDGGVDGLDLVRKLLLDAPRVLSPGGAIGLEIDPSQSESVAEIAKRVFPEARFWLMTDLAGHPRHAMIET